MSTEPMYERSSISEGEFKGSSMSESEIQVKKDCSRSESGTPMKNKFSIPSGVMCVMLLSIQCLVSFDDGYFPALLKQIMEYFDVSYIAAGVLGSVYYVGFFISGPLFGYLANLMPPMRILFIAMVIWLISDVAISLSWNYWFMFLFRFTLGIGKAAFSTIVPVILDLIAKPNKRALVIALFMGSMAFGFALGHIVGGLVADHTWLNILSKDTWRVGFLVDWLTGVVALLLFLYIKGPDNILYLGLKGNIDDKDTAWDKIKSISKNRILIWLTLASFLKKFVITGIAFYMIQWVIDDFGITAMRAGLLIGIITLVTVLVGNIFGGLFLGRLIKKHKCNSDEAKMCVTSTGFSLVFNTITIIPASLLPFVNQFPLFCVTFTVMSLLLWISAGSLSSSILWSVELKNRTFARSLSNLCISLGYVPAPVVIGALKDSFGWSWAMLVALCLCVPLMLFIFLAYILAKRDGRNLYNKQDGATTELSECKNEQRSTGEPEAHYHDGNISRKASLPNSREQQQLSTEAQKLENQEADSKPHEMIRLCDESANLIV